MYFNCLVASRVLIQKGAKLESRGELGCVYIIYIFGHLYRNQMGIQKSIHRQFIS